MKKRNIAYDLGVSILGGLVASVITWVSVTSWNSRHLLVKMLPEFSLEDPIYLKEKKIKKTERLPDGKILIEFEESSKDRYIEVTGKGKKYMDN